MAVTTGINIIVRKKGESFKTWLFKNTAIIKPKTIFTGTVPNIKMKER